MASLQIKEIYEGLKSLEPTAKGIESRFIDTHVTRLYELYRYAYNLTETPKPLTEIKEFLRQLDPEQIVEELMAYCFGPVLKQEDDHGIYVDRLMANAMKKKPNGETRKIIANQLSLAVRGLGIPDLDRNIEPIEITERLKTDSRYLHKIAKNIQVLPLLGELRLINYFSALITSNDYVETHAVSELGLPAYRIGAAVLSDFAVYTGDKLPPSFWLAHWTSHISFAEHSKTDSKIQNEALRAASLYVDDILLTYSSISDIVCDVLERG